jgi:hypothetical protein
VLIGWPETLLSWDVLFLIPLRWWGPVLSPVLIAALICVSAVLVATRMKRGQRLEITPVNAGCRRAAGAVRLHVGLAARPAARLGRLGYALAGAFQVALVLGGAGLDGPAQPEDHLVGALQPAQSGPLSLAKTK